MSPQKFIWASFKNRLSLLKKEINWYIFIIVQKMFRINFVVSDGIHNYSEMCFNFGK